MRHLRFFSLLWLILMAGTAPARADADAAPVQVVEHLTNQVLQVLQSNQGKPLTPAIKAKIADIVLPHMDFMTMSQYVMAQYWRQMTPAPPSIPKVCWVNNSSPCNPAGCRKTSNPGAPSP